MEMSLDNLSSAQKDELMSSVKQQIALANAQELLTVGFIIWLKHCRVNNRGSVCFVENDGKVLQEVRRQARTRAGQFRTGKCRFSFDPNEFSSLPFPITEMHCHVYGPVHGFLESGVPNLHATNPEGTEQRIRKFRSYRPAGSTFCTANENNTFKNTRKGT